MKEHIKHGNMEQEVIKENDLIFLILDNRRRWLVQVKSGESFHTHKGTIDFDEIIGKHFGTCVFSKPHESQGYKFYIFKPLPSDYILHMARKTQIIYPKDAGLILLYSGIGPGSIVIEAGCGSGALSCILGNFIRPMGHLYSYDVRDKSLKRARKNVLRANLQDYISITRADIINDDLDHENVDSIVLDMAMPWEAIKKVRRYLKFSGTLASFSPTIEQVKKTNFALKENDFHEIHTYELLMRNIQVKENATRPEFRMIGHSGYLTFARKVKDIKNPYREKIPKKPEFIDLNDMPLR
ncbi:MAG: tRNA (adenine-N1)-methyltransferase [Promethearchaeota archaeon]|nr:MAG: tRNA (adenine-N1)-methyltransferase [Candidatus Lokiarchaeota archaeon]